MASQPFLAATVSPATFLPHGQQALTRGPQDGNEGQSAVQSVGGASQSAEPALIDRAVGAASDSAQPEPSDEEGTRQVERAVERLNEMMQSGQSMLKFELNDEAGRMVVRVLDAETEELIRQIPSEETLKFAEYVEGLVGLIFNDQA